MHDATPDPPARNNRVLVIDDNPSIHTDIRKILCPEVSQGAAALDALEAELLGGESLAPTRAAASFAVDSAYQGREGLVHVQQAVDRGEPYAMAFVDVRMPPGWDGLRTAQAMGTYERRFQYLAKVHLLIIDDFGLKPLRSPEDEYFHDLISERYERTATILTSNLDFEEWGAAFPSNKMIGAATLDRLRHGAYKLELDGESYRGLKPASEKITPPAKGGKPGAK